MPTPSEKTIVRKKKTWLKITLFLVFLFGLGISYVLFIEPYWIKVTHHTVHIKTPLLKPIKIAHLSDLHTRGVGRREQKLFSLLESEKPDLIVISGDTVTLQTTASELFDTLSHLHAPLGVFAVRGNWDRDYHLPNEEETYKKAGVYLLHNESIPILDNIRLLGFDQDWPSEESTFLQKALNSLPSSSFCIALFHEPAFFDSLSTRCNLSLAGHTHGGQVRIPFLSPFWLPPGSGPYVAGWYQKHQSQMYVSQGIGTSIYPIRFFCRPEIAMITLATE